MWVIGKLFKLAMLLLLLAIIASIGFVFFVSPDHFKPRITEMVRNYTGQPFVINGPVEWTLRPRTVINMHDLVLPKSADDKTPVIQIKDAIIDLDVVALLKKNATIHSVVLSGVVMDWKLTKAIIANNDSNLPTVVKNFTLTNGTMTIQDPTENLNWALQNVTLSANNFLINGGQDIPNMHMQGDLVNVDRNTKYAVDTTIKYDRANNLLNLDPLKLTWNDTALEGTATINQLSTDPIISGSMSMNPTDVGALLKKMDPYYANSNAKLTHTLQMKTGYSYSPKDQILDLTKLNLQIDKGVLSGDAKLGLVSPYHAEFTLSADNLDFAPLTMLGSALFPSIHTMTALPMDFIKNISVSGKFSGTQLAINHDIMIDQLHLEVNGQGGVIQFTPVIINAYGGTHNVGFSIDATKQDPEFMLNEQADKVDLEPWLKAMQGEALVTGTASIKASVRSTGSDIEILKQNMSGGITLIVNNGSLAGFDANKLMQFSNQTVTEIFSDVSSSPAANLNVLAVKLSSDWIKTQQDRPMTKFDHLEFNAQIEKGVTKQSSMAMNNSMIDLKATGQFKISTQAINYDANMVNRIDIPTDIKALSGYMKQTPLSMTITGTLNKPIFGPNVQTYVAGILKATQTDLMNQAINRMVSATPPNIKTSKTASDLFIDSLQSLNK